MPDNRSETYSKGNQSNDIAGFLVSNADLSVIQNCRQLYKISPGGSDGKESACNAEDLGLILGLGRSPGGGHGNPLQYSCLESLQGQRSLAGYSPWGCKELDTAHTISQVPFVSYFLMTGQQSLLYPTRVVVPINHYLQRQWCEPQRSLVVSYAFGTELLCRLGQIM